MTVLVAASFVIAVIAAIALSVTGFGNALVSIPLLALVTDPITAVVASTVLGGILSARLAWRDRHHIVRPMAAKFTIAAVFGMPVGLVVMTVSSERVLLVVIGIVLAVAVIALSSDLHIPQSIPARLSLGALSGAMLTSTGMNGPPAVLALDSLNLSPRSFRATLQTIFCAQDLVAVAAFLALGRMTATVWLVVGISIIGFPLGLFLGERIFTRMSQVQFRRGVLIMLLATAAVAIASAVIP